MPAPRTIFLLFICFLKMAGANAQTGKIDSLLAELKAIPVDADTAHLNQRAKLHYRISSNYSMLKEYDKSRQYARAALRLAAQTKNGRALAMSLGNIAFTYDYQGRYPEALDTFLLSLSQWEAVRDTGKMANIATSISTIYYEMRGQLDKELAYAQLCRGLTERAHRLHGLCACTHLVGDIFDRMGKPDSAGALSPAQPSTVGKNAGPARIGDPLPEYGANRGTKKQLCEGIRMAVEGPEHPTAISQWRRGPGKSQFGTSPGQLLSSFRRPWKCIHHAPKGDRIW